MLVILILLIHCIFFFICRINKKRRNKVSVLFFHALWEFFSTSYNVCLFQNVKINQIYDKFVYSSRRESRLWRLEDKHLREGSSVRQFGRPRPLRIRHRRRRSRRARATLTSNVKKTFFSPGFLIPHQMSITKL